MKKINLIIISIIFFLTSLNVKAISYDEIKSRNVCANFELALVSGVKELKKVECYNTYQDAYNAFSKLNNEQAVILERKNNVTRFVNAKLALVYLGVRGINENTLYYYSSDLKTEIGYLNHNSYYGATDGVFLDFNYSNHAIKVRTNGITGWIKDGYYQIVPIGFEGSINYYEVTSTELKHFKYWWSIKSCYR